MNMRFVPRVFDAGADFFVLQTFKYAGIVLQPGDDFRVLGLSERTLRSFHNARLIGCAPGDARPAKPEQPPAGPPPGVPASTGKPKAPQTAASGKPPGKVATK